MSYILDALRRAERERDMGKAPSIDSLNRAPSSPITRAPRSVWALAIATAVIAAVALMVLLWPKSKAPPAAEPVATSGTPPVVAAAQPELALPGPAPSDAPAAIEDREDLASLDDVTVEAPAAAPAAPLQPEDLAPAPTPTAGTEAAASAPLPPDSAAAAAAAVPAPESGKSTIVVPPGVTVLREMPAAYREQFPIQALDVHVYDPDPARRWVMIEGRRYHEGETVASGPNIAQITETGVILDYQGARVLLPVR